MRYEAFLCYGRNLETMVSSFQVYAAKQFIQGLYHFHKIYKQYLMPIIYVHICSIDIVVTVTLQEKDSVRTCQSAVS